VQRFVATVERTAGYFIGFLALITVSEAALRYLFNSHIPDSFVIAVTLQGIAICWGIACATYADRHITVEIVYSVVPKWLRRAFDVFGYTLNLLFLSVFGYAIVYKVFDTYAEGEISSEILMPLWIGYSFAALGILAAIVTGAIRWWQVVIEGQVDNDRHG
jgi:C4-dicarboxylate transporter DctQ subunit